VAEGYYTVILVPDARSAFRKIRVPVRLIRTVAGAAGAVALAVGALLAHYAWLNCQVSELDAVRLENAVLSEQTHRYGESLGQLESRITRLQSSITKLAVMSSLEQTLPAADGVVVGVGGVTGVDPDPPSRDPDVTLHALSRSLSDLAARSQRIETFYADQTALLSHTPSVWPVRGYFSSGFGSRVDPFTGRKDFHPGIDVSAPRGTKAVAPADGVVLAVGRRGAYGLAIIIDHGTGRSNAPHLHYEVWLDDKAQNPIHYILDEYRSFG
jgi:murein DD-endopeptidase MepM/ murein hydrolase activator NlpD